MDDQKRQFYLENTWQPYPQMASSALSVSDFYVKFAKISMGQTTPKTPDFILAGRLYGNTLESGGKSIELDVPKDNEIFEILQDGDQVLVSALWSTVTVEAQAFESKPKKIRALKIELLAPALTLPPTLNMCIERGKQWQYFLHLIRKTFQVLEFTEVKTPTLVPSPGTEPHLDHFTTQFRNQKYYLPTSPELHLKKMLSRGWTKIYEFKPCFRNNELSEHHQPEFTMLEWYRAYSNLDHIEKDIKGMFNYLKLHWPDPVSSFGFLTSTTVQELFQKYCDFNLTPQTNMGDIQGLAQKLDIATNPNDSWDDIFFRIFLEKIEKNLGLHGPQVVKYYPPSQSALARLTPDGWAARFEVYWKGLEIANAFDELNDPTEQRRRCRADNEQRVALGKPAVPIDEEFINALDCGLPPSAGIALGVDRLFMALVNTQDIATTREFSIR